MVRPANGGTFLATCALGFTDPAMPTGVFACPNPSEMCAVAGGYAYSSTPYAGALHHIALKPVVEAANAGRARPLLFVGFHSIVAWGPHGLAWESARLSWEGVRITGIEGNVLHGMGWNLMTRSRGAVFSPRSASPAQHQGGGFTPPQGKKS